MARLIDADALCAEDFENCTPYQAQSIIDEAPTVDAVHRETLAQVMWERDVAMKQLDEHGIPFGCKADVKAVVHGEWKDRFNNKYDNHILQCSICNKNALYCTITDELGSERNVQVMSAYCPHCGAKMKGTANG